MGNRTMSTSIKSSAKKRARKPEAATEETKVLAINGKFYKSLARCETPLPVYRFGPDEAPLYSQIRNASMPNAQVGYAWPHLAARPRG